MKERQQDTLNGNTIINYKAVKDIKDYLELEVVDASE